MAVQKLAEYIKYLKDGDRKLIAETAGVSVQTVSRVINNPDYNNERVEQFIIEFAEKRKQEIKSKVTAIFL